MDACKLAEQGVIGQLAHMLETGLKTLDMYAGQMETGEMDDLTVQFPCIFTIITKITAETENRLDFGEMELQLIIGDRNLRGHESAMHGDGDSPGVYSLMQSAYDALHNTKLIHHWLPLQMISAMPWIYRPTDGLCIWAQTYNIKGNL